MWIFDEEESVFIEISDLGLQNRQCGRLGRTKR